MVLCALIGSIGEVAATDEAIRSRREFLAQRNLLKKSQEKTVAIDPVAIGGLNITLEQVNSAP